MRDIKEMRDQGPMAQAEFELMLRRWLLKMGGRYVPVVALFLALALVIAFVPTTQPGDRNTTGDVAARASGGDKAATESGEAAPGSSPGGPGASSNAPTSRRALPPGLGSSPGVANGNYAAGSSSGVAKTGVACRTGVRQFAWSRFGPNCLAAFSGSNGGATAPGVTADTVTLSYRLANTAQQSAISALAGSANINQDAIVADLRSYLNFFNSQFELYGRHVALKTYQGQGDYIAEDQGQGLGATQADAVTVHDMGAFGDVTFPLQASQPYEEDLAAEHVIGFSSVALSQRWLEEHAPYAYSVYRPSGTVALQESAATVCRRFAGMPAIFAGDPVYQRTNRVFGIIYPQTPMYTEEVNAYQHQLAACGVKAARVIAYAINVGTFEQQAVSAVAQMKAVGVTTVLCACDPILPIFLSNAADQQNYLPEWVAAYFGDPIARSYNQRVWSHVIADGWQWPAPDTTEAFKTFQLAYPGKQPAETPPSSPRYYYVAYYMLLQIFDALQAAGPNLTPATFEQGMFSLPSSEPGDFIGGQWTFGQKVFAPVASFEYAWWNPNAVSQFDNQKGAYQWCNGGTMYTNGDLAALGGPRQQMACFGK